MRPGGTTASVFAAAATLAAAVAAVSGCGAAEFPWIWAAIATGFLPWCWQQRRGWWGRALLVVLVAALVAQGGLTAGGWRASRSPAATYERHAAVALDAATARAGVALAELDLVARRLAADAGVAAASSAPASADSRRELFAAVRRHLGAVSAERRHAASAAVLGPAGDERAYANDGALAPSERPRRGARLSSTATRTFFVVDQPLPRGRGWARASLLVDHRSDPARAAGVDRTAQFGRSVSGRSVWLDSLRWYPTGSTPPAGLVTRPLAAGGTTLATLAALPTSPGERAERSRWRQGWALPAATAFLGFALALQWARRARQARRPLGLAAAAAAVVATRAVLLALPLEHGQRLEPVFSFASFASSLLGPFSRSPGDLALTGLAAAAAASLLVVFRHAAPPSRGAFWVKTGAWLAGVVGATVALAQLAAAVAANAAIEPFPRYLAGAPAAQICLALGALALGLALTLLLIAAAPPRVVAAAGRPARLALPLAVVALAALPWLALQGWESPARALLWAVAVLALAALADRRAVTLVALWSLLVAAAATQPAIGAAYERARDRLVEERLPAHLLSEEKHRATLLAEELKRFFAGVDLAKSIPGFPRLASADDLAYALWAASSLPLREEPAALRVVRADGVVVAEFADGVPGFVEEGRAALAQDWQAEGFAGRDGSGEQELLHGEYPLSAGGVPWGRAIVHIHGPRRAAVVRAWGSARARPFAPDRAPAALAGVELRLYGHDGHPLAPARGGEESPLPRRASERLAAAGASIWEDLRGAGGRRERAYLVPAGAEVAAFVVRASNPAERAAAVYRALLLLAAAAVPLAALGGIGLGVFGTLSWAPRRWLGTYRRRVLVLYAVVLLVPFLMVLGFARVYFTERLHAETLRLGRLALGVTRHVLEDYMASRGGDAAEPAPDDEVVDYLGQVVGYDIDIYRGTRLVSASHRELFASGLLPSRTPAGTFEALALSGAGDHLDRRRLRGTEYLQIAAPLGIGPPPRSPDDQWIIGVPLVLEQRLAEEEAGRLTDAGLLLVCAVLFAALWLGHWLSQRVARPLAALTAGTEAVARGEYRLALEEPVEEELRQLFRGFRDMSHAIAEKQAALTAEKELAQSVINTVSAGIFTFDGAGMVVMANRLAQELLPGLAPGAPLSATAALADGAVSHVLRGAGPRAGEAVVARDGSDRTLRVVAVPLAESEGLTIVLVEDLTEIAASHRLRAWAEMARRIAHEIKNPLTPIQLAAEHLRAMHRRGETRFAATLEESTATILDQVEQLRSTAVEFGDYARIPAFAPEPVDLGALVEEVLAAYRAPLAERVDVRLDAESGLRAQADPRLLRRALVNVIENALQVMPERGELAVTLHREGDNARIVVADRGPGIDAAHLDDMFAPTFSTKIHGTGLGLALTRRALEEHGGTVEARNRPGGGLEVHLVLPLG